MEFHGDLRDAAKESSRDVLVILSTITYTAYVALIAVGLFKEGSVGEIISDWVSASSEMTRIASIVFLVVYFLPDMLTLWTTSLGGAPGGVRAARVLQIFGLIFNILLPGVGAFFLGGFGIATPGAFGTLLPLLVITLFRVMRSIAAINILGSAAKAGEGRWSKPGKGFFTVLAIIETVVYGLLLASVFLVPDVFSISSTTYHLENMYHYNGNFVPVTTYANIFDLGVEQLAVALPLLLLLLTSLFLAIASSRYSKRLQLAAAAEMRMNNRPRPVVPIPQRPFAQPPIPQRPIPQRPIAQPPVAQPPVAQPPRIAAPAATIPLPAGEPRGEWRPLPAETKPVAPDGMFGEFGGVGFSMTQAIEVGFYPETTSALERAEVTDAAGKADVEKVTEDTAAVEAAPADETPADEACEACAPVPEGNTDVAPDPFEKTVADEPSAVETREGCVPVSGRNAEVVIPPVVRPEKESFPQGDVPPVCDNGRANRAAPVQFAPPAPRPVPIPGSTLLAFPYSENDII